MRKENKRGLTDELARFPMMKRRKKTPRSDKAASRPPETGPLREQLKQLSADQLIEIIEQFLAPLSEKHRLEFLNLLPSVPAQELETHLPYPHDEDFLAAIEDFCERVRSEEFVEYGVGYDREERAHHGFGDDSWIAELDGLFEAAELYFLAHHYETVAQAYRLLFDCLEIQSREGGFYFTTSDPQAALSTDLLKARQRYFEALCQLYTGATLAEQFIEGLAEYRYIGKQPPDVRELFPAGGEIIQLLEAALVKLPSGDDPRFMPPGCPADLLRQIYTHFRSLEELERFARQYGQRQPWVYEELVQAHAGRQDWQQVFLWAEQGLRGQANKRQGRNALLADYKARAAERLGDPAVRLAALWEAFESEANVERYVALRQAAKAQGQWVDYCPRIVERLTHNLSGNSALTGHLWDNRLLVEALLVESEYERALERAAKPHSFDYWDERGNAQKAALDFFLHSVIRALDPAARDGEYPEIAIRLKKPSELIERLRDELFQAPLSKSERDRQIAWIIQLLRPRIDQIVSHKQQMAYAEAAHDARLIVELYGFQRQPDKAQKFLAELDSKYPRHRNFSAELKKLGLKAK
jgi:hypothetical protein